MRTQTRKTLNIVLTVLLVSVAAAMAVVALAATRLGDYGTSTALFGTIGAIAVLIVVIWAWRDGRRTTITALALATLGSGAAYANTNTPKDIDSLCRAEWPGDFQMIEHCIETQRAASDELHDFFAEYAPWALETEGDEQIVMIRQKLEEEDTAAIIFLTCLKRWQPPEYQMLNHCVQTQVKSARRTGDLE